MNEPKRWIEEGPPVAVERLLEAAAAEEPSERSLQRVLAGVGAGLGAAGVAASAGAASAGAASAAGAGVALSAGNAAAWSGVWVKWVFLGVAAVGAGTAAVKQVAGGGAAPRAVVTAAQVPPSAPPVTPAAVPAAPATVAAPPAVLEPVAVPPTKPSPSVGAKSAPAAAPVAEAPVDVEKLAEEVRAVDRARSALTSGRASEALVALDEYERSGGRRFAPEALYLRMQALLSMGRHAEARATAQRLVRAFPQSPHTARARRVLESIP